MGAAIGEGLGLGRPKSLRERDSWWRRVLLFRLPDWVAFVFFALAMAALLLDVSASLRGGILLNPQIEGNPLIRGILVEAGPRGYAFWLFQEILLAASLVALRPAFGLAWNAWLVYEHFMGFLSWL